jgi:splicing factor U2AF 65 kDa subunit
MDGVLFRSMSLRMRRPNDYNESICPPQPPPPGFDPAMLGIVSTQVGDGPNKVFIGGIPYSLNEDAIKELLQTYGRLSAFNLIKDPNTGLSKGFAFFEYADTSIVDQACANLNGTSIGDKQLTVRRATQHGASGGARSTPGVSGVLHDAGAGGYSHGAVPAAALVRQSTRIVELQNVVTAQELEDDDEYRDVVEETEDEARRCGALQKIVVPRPAKAGEAEVKGVGRVFLVYEKKEEAERAFAAMDGRKFEDRRVNASYITEEAFESGNY